MQFVIMEIITMELIIIEAIINQVLIIDQVLIFEVTFSNLIHNQIHLRNQQLNHSINFTFLHVFLFQQAC